LIHFNVWRNRFSTAGRGDVFNQVHFFRSDTIHRCFPDGMEGISPARSIMTGQPSIRLDSFFDSVPVSIVVCLFIDSSVTASEPSVFRITR
jgi:hypothetical protein